MTKNHISIKYPGKCINIKLVISCNFEKSGDIRTKKLNKFLLSVIVSEK